MEAQYSQRLEKIEAVLDRRLPTTPDAAWTAANFTGLASPPPASLARLTAPGRDLLDRGGKRWRPLLSVLVCEALGGGGAAYPLAPLVELPHSASLIHDDIEDHSKERRGRPAVHLIYGEDTAINSGAFLYFLPLACLDEWDVGEERKWRLARDWGEHLRRLHLGQAMDIAWHRDFDLMPTLDEYDRMCRLKTGVLARFAARLGVFAAGLPAALEETAATDLGAAAESLGVGFQILDDAKNLSGGIAGKQRGDDIVENKKSLPVLLYLAARPDAVDQVRRCFRAARAGGVGAPETAELIAAMDAAGAIAEARRRGEALVTAAAAALAGPAFGGSARDPAAQTALAGLAGLIG